MAPRRTSTTFRPSPALQALLGLSGLLARAKQGGVLSEALALVLEGTGTQRGALYQVKPDGLELVADEGLSTTLRAYIATFPSSEAPWFPAQIAAKKRRVTTNQDAVTALAGRIDEALVQGAGWCAMIAAPIMIGRDVLGVLVIAAPSADAIAPEAPFVLESAANMLALSISVAEARERGDMEQKSTAVDGRGAPDTKLARLAVLGSLAAGFADEMRWPLSSLGNQLAEQEKLIDGLRMRYPGVANAFDDLARIQDEASTALRFARKAGTRLLTAIEDGSAEPIDVEDLAHEATALVEPTARAKNVDLLVTALRDGSLVVIGKRSELGQLLLSLLANGVEACASIVKPMGEDGEAPQKPLVCVTVTRENDKVILRVEDAGPGISPDVRPRIFDPFFTTKKDSLGLGLTLARQVALAYGGTLELDRSDLGGVLVRVVLPAAPAGVEVIRREPPPPSRRKTIVGAPPSREKMPPTARDGWTSAPKPIEKSSSKKPVRAPVASPHPLVVAADTDVCAPTQRVPRTPSGGMPAQTPKVPVPRRTSAGVMTPKVTVVASPSRVHQVITNTEITPTPAAAGEVAPTGSVVPTDRVPEGPRRSPRSRRSKG